METYDLGGHSGCRITLMEDGSRNWVRKISGDKSYNSRLESQCRKQQSFNSPTIRVPQVYDYGFTEDGLFYFDMEYIHGITLSQHIKRIEIGKIRNIVSSLIEGLSFMPSSGNPGNDVNDIFRNKISDLKGRECVSGNLVALNAISVLEAHDWSNFDYSLCHGDLTLENIMIKNDEIILIDFLDSFYDCWLLDISTLLQDVHILWAYRSDRNLDMNTILRLEVFRDVLLDVVEERRRGMRREVYYALLLKLVRILPYTHDEETYEFLQQRIRAVLDYVAGRQAL